LAEYKRTLASGKYRQIALFPVSRYLGRYVWRTACCIRSVAPEAKGVAMLGFHSARLRRHQAGGWMLDGTPTEDSNINSG